MPDVEAKAQEGGDVGPVIQDEVWLDSAALFQFVDELAVKLPLVANLHSWNSRIHQRGNEAGEIEAVELLSVENRVKQLLLHRRLIVGVSPSGDFQAAANPAEALARIGGNRVVADPALLRTRRGFVGQLFFALGQLVCQASILAAPERRASQALASST